MSRSLAESNILAGPHPIVPPGPTPRRLDKHFDFLEWSTDGDTLLLGTSNLTSRSWGGSVWLFSSEECKGAEQSCGWQPSANECIVGAAIDCGVTTGCFLDSPEKFVVGCDSGALQVLATSNVSVPPSDNNESHPKVKLIGQGSLCEHNDSVSALDSLGSDSADVVSGSYDKSLKVWDLDSLVSKLTYSPAHAHLITSVRAHLSDPNVFSSCALDGTATLWDIRNASPATGILKTDGLGLTSLAWTDEFMLAVGAVNGQISLVDIRHNSVSQASIELGKRPVHSLRSMPKASSIIGACQDNTSVTILKISAISTLHPLYSNDNHGDFVRGLSWHPKKNSLWTCGWDSKIYAHQFCDNFIVNGGV